MTSQHCEFGASWNENVCDQILLPDKDLTRKMQLTKDVTLAPIFETVRKFEEVAFLVSIQGEAVKPHKKSLTDAVNITAKVVEKRGEWRAMLKML